MGGGVGGGVGEVIKFDDVDRVVQPTPKVAQQYSCFSSVHMSRVRQSKTYVVVVEGHKSQSNKGSNTNKLNKPQPVMMHVKSLARTSEKSPPKPTYL